MCRLWPILKIITTTKGLVPYSNLAFNITCNPNKTHQFVGRAFGFPLCRNMSWLKWRNNRATWCTFCSPFAWQQSVSKSIRGPVWHQISNYIFCVCFHKYRNEHETIQNRFELLFRDCSFHRDAIIFASSSADMSCFPGFIWPCGF